MKLIYTILFIFLFSNLQSQTTGDLDLDFGENGYRVINFGFVDSKVTCQEIQSDGKIIISGYAKYFENTNNYRAFMLRLNNDGTTDNSFGQNGIVSSTVDTYNGGIAVVKLKSNGKILFGDNSRIFQYNSDGVLDTTFGNNGTIYGVFYCSYNIPLIVKDIAIDNQDNFYALYHFDSNPCYQTHTIFKHLSNGDKDLTFSYTGSSGGNGTVLLQNDNNLITGYNYSTNIGFAAGYYVKKVNSLTGTQIYGFSSFNNYVGYPNLNSILSLSNNEVITNTTTDNETLTFKYNSNLSLDETFGNNGSTNVYPRSKKISLDNNNKLLFLNYDLSSISFYRGNLDGSIDTSFSNNGLLNYPLSTEKFAVDFDVFNSSLIISGNTSQNDIFISKGFYESNLNNHSTSNSSIEAISIYPNPSSNYIKLNGIENYQNVSISITNIQGQIIKEFKAVKNERINISDLNDGLYFLNINNETLKFFKSSM